MLILFVGGRGFVSLVFFPLFYPLFFSKVFKKSISAVIKHFLSFCSNEIVKGFRKYFLLHALLLLFNEVC